MKCFLASVALFFLSTVQGLNAQVTGMCAYDLVLQKLAASHPGFEESCSSLHAHTVREAQRSVRSNTVYELPVVFHIVWNDPSENLSDDVIFDQLEILNRDFRRLNPDADQTREVFLDVAADTQIEFVLADTDPEGNPTNGINRFETNRETFDFDLFSQTITLDEVKSSATGGVDAWNTNEYLNIWVCNIGSTLPGVQPFGFAYPPNGAPNWEGLFPTIADEVQGVVVHYTTVGSNNPAGLDDDFPGNEGGRTLTHEIGHYLGLRHTWGDAFFNGCSADDGITDTPNISSNNNFACNFNLNTCNEGEGDLPDMGENYMDYNQDDCLNVFTLGQKAAMRFVIENFRPDLVEGQINLSVQNPTRATFSLYPNPANQAITVEGFTGGDLLLYDLTGRMVAVFNQLPPHPTVQVDHLPRGVFVLSDRLGVTQHRLVLQ